MSTTKNIKALLHQQLQDEIQERINSLQTTIASLQESRNKETKSSVGDKYETGRAMMQQEIFRKEEQLQQALELRLTLRTIKPSEKYTTARQGSLVETSQGSYFLSVGLGKIKIEGRTYFAISVKSPIGAALLGKQQGDYIEFRGKRISIDQIL